VIGPEPLPEDADEPRLVVLPDAQPELAALRGRRRRGRRPAEQDLRADRLLTQCLGDRGQRLLLLRTAEEGLGDPLEWLGQPGGDDRLDPREVVEERPPGDAGAVGDLFRGDMLEASFLTELAGGIDHRLPGTGLV